MAHKKGVGSSDNGRDSHSKRLGVKLFGGQTAKAGNIIIRQRGTKFHAGANAYLGKDFTIHAAVDGKVVFKRSRLNRTFVSVVPAFKEVAETVATLPNTKPVTPAEPVNEPIVAATEQADDLTKIEGIGPKIAELLTNAGITTFEALAATDADKVRAILEEAGSRYKSHDPTTWSKQAAMAAAGNWEELKTYQDHLDGGKEPTE